MNQLSNERRSQVVRCLVEGNSIRATVRLTGASKNTIAKLLTDIGAACSSYQDKVLRNLPCMVVQCDEIWSFVGCKQKNLPKGEESNRGDVWTWVGLDADSKLAICWYLGNRDASSAHEFISDLASRLSRRVQLTTDGHKAYIKVIQDVFGNDIDYAMLVKLYGEDFSGEKRYSPAVCTGCKQTVFIGDPVESQISTSYIERANLTMRMSNRRFTRLTNAFSKKLENHAAAVSLHFMYYNFGRPHQTLTKDKGTKYTPAMAAGVTDHVWSVDEIVALLD